MDISVQTKSRNFDLEFFLLGVTIILLMLQSMRAWFTWNWNVVVVDILAFSVICIYLGRRINTKSISKNASILFFVIFASLWNTQLGVGSILSICLPFCLALLLSKKEKIVLLQWWTVTYAIILSVSLIAWLISWTGYLPDIGLVQYLDIDNYIYKNYILCIRGSFYDVRFNSIFLEPGHVGMISAFTCYANRFNLKNIYILLIFICTLFTFSLAGYVLLFGGYLIFLASHIYKLTIKNVVLTIFLFGLIGSSFLYTEGDILFNKLIMERLELDESKIIVGNNRTGEHTDQVYKNFIESENVLIGLPQKKLKKMRDSGEIRGAGYKIYMLQKGIIGTLFVFLFYYSLCITSKNRRFALGMLVLYIAAFWQRAYPMWYSWMFLFLFAMSIKDRETSNLIKEVKV